MSLSPKKNVSFYRQFRRLTGGHLKVWHYFQHIAASEYYKPSVYFAEGSMMNEENPWHSEGSNILKNWDPTNSDVVFLGGLDWLSIPERNRNRFEKPVINLIQGIRHANPGTQLYSFLSYRAVRICVSHEVQNSLEATGIVNGPVFTIENGIDISVNESGTDLVNRKFDVVISGIKNPALALEIKQALEVYQIKTVCLTSFIQRSSYIEYLRQSKIALVLPLDQEGYYLPYWEALSMGCMVICPQHKGATSTFKEGITGFYPSYRKEAIIHSILQCMNLDRLEIERIQASGKILCKERTIEKEREQFHKILEHIIELYR